MSFNGYFETFLEKNNIPHDAEKMTERTLTRDKRIREIIKDVFKSKYGVEMKDSKLGRLILNSYTFMTYDEMDNDKPLYLYNISFNDKDSLKIDFISDINGLTKVVVKSKDDICSIDDGLKEEIAKAIGVNEVENLSAFKVDDSHMLIEICSMTYILKNDELADFSIDEQYKNIQAKAKQYSGNIANIGEMLEQEK